jgi:hypothetical protein
VSLQLLTYQPQPGLRALDALINLDRTLIQVDQLAVYVLELGDELVFLLMRTNNEDVKAC